MTTRSRYATPAMVRALIARDGGCAAPGCTAQPGLTDAHHIIWWSRGGTTTVGNLTLLCPRHHRDVHADRLEVTARDGVPWFRRPRGRSAGPDDPTLDWHRGSYLDATRRARRLGQRLVADAADRRYRSPPWAA